MLLRLAVCVRKACAGKFKKKIVLEENCFEKTNPTKHEKEVFLMELQWKDGVVGGEMVATKVNSKFQGLINPEIDGHNVELVDN
jgi:hypothetical protein